MISDLFRKSFRFHQCLPVAAMLFLSVSCSVYDSNLLNSESDSITDPRSKTDSSLDASFRRDAEAGSGGATSETGPDAPDSVVDADLDTDSDVGLFDAETDAKSDDDNDARTDTESDAEIDEGIDTECVPIPDSDSKLDCCPDDPAKTEPGVCGCGVEDSDRDSDEVSDCLDKCPDDPAKTKPGICGCGKPDLDGDSDDTADCLDGCPQDPNKIEPGICGCGLADEQAGCLGLRNALIHRYSFAGSGTTVTDSVGGADGTVVNTELNDTGSLELAGSTSEQYADLPDGLISGLVDASFEIWVTWNGGSTAWQRIFDFGSSDNGSEQGSGITYAFLTPMNGVSPYAITFAYTINGSLSEQWISAGTFGPMKSGATTHVVVVIDDTNDRMWLYVNGEPDPSEGVAFSGSLSAIEDVNNWLGRSQYSTDPEFGGSLHEFRIYDAALSAEQIQTSYAAGPDPAFF